MVKLAEQMQASERQCKFANSQKIFLVYCPIVSVCALWYLIVADTALSEVEEFCFCYS